MLRLSKLFRMTKSEPCGATVPLAGAPGSLVPERRAGCSLRGAANGKSQGGRICAPVKGRIRLNFAEREEVFKSGSFAAEPLALRAAIDARRVAVTIWEMLLGKKAPLVAARANTARGAESLERSEAKKRRQGRPRKILIAAKATVAPWIFVWAAWAY